MRLITQNGLFSGDRRRHLLAILVLCLFLLPVTIQMAHTHPIGDGEHQDCPACLFITAFHPTTTTNFVLVLEEVPSGEFIPFQGPEITPQQILPTQPQRAPPHSV